MTLTGNHSIVDSGFDAPPSNPMLLFKQWLNQADVLKISEPRGFVLSTVDNSGKPSSRVVLLKDLDDKGIIFSSSSLSQKGKDLSSNPIVSGTLWWRETMQQINFAGAVTILPDDMSDAIFNERTMEAKAVASISIQSDIMRDEQLIRAAVTSLIKADKPISRPKTWHAYHIKIDSIEFWLGSADRFHNRLHYDLKAGIWHHHKLQP
jgi:dihydrophenazinedicarboxylate synthase